MTAEPVEPIADPTTTIEASPSLREPTLQTTQEQAMSITESSSKILEPQSYDKVINDPIHGRRWREAIEDELQNLENHQAWEYDELPPDWKTIGSK